ncbi:adenosylcobalamin-dependent ribonucleoside-diphosphate reductase [Caenispirillum salinarum]|uniref:adenosylcobalamin-dependent ribonucleoside-diphosphate reductase n=1 Tax=Caenispirillum salinarum TaxID=859058 RepID=UPI00384E29B2
MHEPTGIAQQIWDMKYRLKQADGTAIDRTVEDTWARVARALAAPEADPAAWEPRFLEALRDFVVLPGGRILAGAGTRRRVTLFNCFVMGRIEDDMASIFEHLKEAALTMQQGGGIGYDFSTLRPRGAPVQGVQSDASGPISFMDVWDAMCRTIMSAGSRRGAMMGVLRCDHPDIEEFIDAKRDPGRLRMFNVSVLVTDAFMDAVREDADWPLVFGGVTYRTIRARALWDRIMRATYDVAEPGVVFIDRINERNPLRYCEEISSTNPCGEQPLPPYGTCLLGSVNLAKMVDRPFEDGAALDLDLLEARVAVAVRMLDNVVDVSGYPLDAQQQEAQAKRRVGLGVTGLADALVMCGARYGSADAVRLTEAWLARLRRTAYLTSADLAAEKGPFPLYDRDAYMASPTIQALDADVREAIAAKGMRNGLVTSIAPTGTISLYADNVSSGLEPVFSYTYTRRVLMPDGSRREETVADFAYALFRERFGPEAPLPPTFVSAMELSPRDHLVMQAAVQKYIDSGISKTINVPEDIDFDAFQDVYRQAYDLGCKGCTTYRPNAVTGAVLELAREEGNAAAGLPTDTLPPEPGAPTPPHPGPRVPETTTAPPDRPETLPGYTYKLRWPESDHATYITINDVVEHGRRRPFEVFINSKNMEHYAWTVALTRMISAVFRRGGDIGFVVEELKAVFDPRGGQWMNGRYVPSILAAIGGVIEQHMIRIGFLKEDDLPRLGLANGNGVGPGGADGSGGAARLRTCPKCGQPALVRQEGCDTCTACGYSRCS